MDTSRTPDTLHVLNAGGDTTISWNPANPDEVAEAQAQVDALRAQGFTFFRVDGSPAPETISAGLAVLNCRRIPAEEVVRSVPPAAPAPPTPAAATPLHVGLGPRPRAALRQANLLTFEALTEKTEAELLNLTGFGAGSLEILRAALAARGLALAGAGPAAAVPVVPTPQRTVATRPVAGG